MYFCYFIIIYLEKRMKPFVWTNLNPLHLIMLCVAFCWSWASGLGRFLKFVYVFFLISWLSSHAKKRGPSFERNQILLHKDTLCLVWLKLDQWFWRSFWMHFFKFVIISSWKMAWPVLWIIFTSLSSRIHRCFVQSLVEFGHVLWEKKI